VSHSVSRDLNGVTPPGEIPAGTPMSQYRGDAIIAYISREPISRSSARFEGITPPAHPRIHAYSLREIVVRTCRSPPITALAVYSNCLRLVEMRNDLYNDQKHDARSSNASSAKRSTCRNTTG